MARQSDSRERLVAAAADSFWKGSYDAVGVDTLCARASVTKGSFYHFFSSKCNLGLAALELNWNRTRETLLEPAFDPHLPPLERFAKLFDLGYALYAKTKEQEGMVFGCPFGNMGAELATKDEQIRAKVEELLARMGTYFEGTLRALRDAGSLPPATDVQDLARQILIYWEGTLLLAKIHKDPSVIKQAKPGVFAVIGVDASASAQR